MTKFIIYGGVKYFKVRHAIYCKKCEQTIESNYQHDFKTCLCKSISIDGGIEDGRILGNLNEMEDRSMYCAELGNDKKFKLWLPLKALV